MDIRWHLLGLQNVYAIQPDAWWELGWGDTYVLFHDTIGPRTLMALRVERCRIPLASADSKINRGADMLLHRMR
jgi:hypothetical protein